MTLLLNKSKLLELLNNYVRVVKESLPSAAKMSLASFCTKKACEERNEAIGGVVKQMHGVVAIIN